MKYEQMPPGPVSGLRLDRDVFFDAWWYTFMAENNIEYSINPEGVAGPEQLRFMVALEPDQIYVPCRDEIFFALLNGRRGGEMPAVLRNAYAGAWRLAIATIQRLTRDTPTPGKRRRMLLFCRHRLRSSLAVGTILPARLIKRLLTTILTLNRHEDPWAASKQAASAAMAAFLASPAWRAIASALPQGADKPDDLPALRHALDMAELARLMLLSAYATPNLPPELPDTATFCARAQALAPGLARLFSQASQTGEGGEGGKTFMFVGDSESGVMADLPFLRALTRQGHRVVLALKGLPLFAATTVWDCETDPVLAEATRGLPRLTDGRMGKNELLRQLSLNRFIVINDGTGELLNLYRTSVTFARAWKECDAIIVKGRRQGEQLLGTSTRFTRDILCYWRTSSSARGKDAAPRPAMHASAMCPDAWPHDDGMRVGFIPCAEHAARFSEADLNAHADAIIAAMRQARAEGKTVMFYSCVIGSIPGEIDTAIRIVTAFIRYLRERLDQVLIINPTEHVVPGMDADDLMFMWERVQRSGLIQTWRFQTADDIETSFALLGQKVPPIWAGKDATYSTGCTKELRIALDMQRLHPEMQILGPAVDKFFRRGEYGVGKFHDAMFDA